MVTIRPSLARTACPAQPCAVTNTSAGIFAPAFVFVAVSGPLIPWIRKSPVAGAVEAGQGEAVEGDEDAEGDPQELVHERPQDTHVGLTSSFESFGFGTKNGVATKPTDRREIESLAEISIAGLAQSGFGFQRAA